MSMSKPEFSKHIEHLLRILRQVTREDLSLY